MPPTVPEPNPRPPRVGSTPSQSAIDAPSGRVTTYAAQNPTTGLTSRAERRPTITAMMAAKKTAPPR
nr:hypothetical protein [Microbacterium testaceum]